MTDLVMLTPQLLDRIVTSLEGSAESLGAISDEDLLATWQGALHQLRDANSASRQQLDPRLTEIYGFSPASLQAALESMFDGVMGEHARAVFEAAEGRRNQRPMLVVLASNIPALVVQALLPALALRRPVLLKSASSEPLLAALLVDLLVDQEPRLRGALAAVSWPGGDRRLEGVVLPRMARVVAYGGGETIADLTQRCPSQLIALGPKVSIAVLGAEVDPEDVALGLAEDIALFEQRGCLSIQAVFTFGDAHALADSLAGALRATAERWPVQLTEASSEVMAALRQLRDEAVMRGLYQPSLELHHGTVRVEDPISVEDSAGQEVTWSRDVASFELSPGGRCVRIYPVTSRRALVAFLAPWGGHLQGVALAGEAWALESQLVDLGVSRCALPGQLQHPDSSWRNGGVSLLDALAKDPDQSM